MIHYIETGWLFGRSQTEELAVAELTWELRNETVIATAALSGLSIGHTPDTAGAASATIREIGVFKPNGDLEIQVLDQDPKHNQVFVEHCGFLGFRLAATRAEAFGLATVFSHGYTIDPRSHVSAPRYSTRDFRMTTGEQGSGDRCRSTHRVCTLEEGSALDVEALVERWSAEVAACWGRERDSLAMEEGSLEKWAEEEGWAPRFPPC